ncbi:MAG: hypothetical protein JST63_09890 [Bacteroidetes bacterium]|nr:hypothetical protein [Bacteroidota bacterium]
MAKGKQTRWYSSKKCRIPATINIAGKLKLVKGDNLEIIKGIKVFTGSGYTYNLQYVVVSSGIYTSCEIYTSIKHVDYQKELLTAMA